MERVTAMCVSCAALFVFGAFAQEEKVPVKVVLPKPQFGGTPKDVRSDNLEPDRGGSPRPAIYVPAGADRLISRGCIVTSSTAVPVFGELSCLTDGDKEHDPAAYVELDPDTQWVQIDLGRERTVYAVCVWHYHGEPRIYRDVVCTISNDSVFKSGVVTVFNNDHDNSSKLGPGGDKEYYETHEGRLFGVQGVKGRYVRLYSRGNTSNDMNTYAEVEVYGK